MRFITPAISTRHQSSIDAHVQYMRSAGASAPAGLLKGVQSTQDRASDAKDRTVSSQFRTVTESMIDGEQPTKVPRSDQYRSLFGRPIDIVRSILRTSPAQDIEAPHADIEYAPQACSEASSSDSGYQSDGSSEDSINSNATSLLDSDGESVAHLLEIAEVSICKDAQREKLLAQLYKSQHQMCLQELQYRDLQEKYNIQIAQRKADYAKVMEAFDQVESAEAYSCQLEQEMSKLESNHSAAQKELHKHATMIAELQAELRKKDESFAEIGLARNNAVEACITALASDLAQRDHKIQELEAANVDKDNTIKQVESVKDDIQLKLRQMVEAAEINRKTWTEEAKTLSEDAYRRHLDHQDSLQKPGAEILRLTNDNRRLELQKTTLSLTASHPQGDGFACAGETFLECEEMRKDAATLRRTIMIRDEKIENVCEQMQQRLDHWNNHHEKEKVAQVECRQLRIQLSDAQEMIQDRDERIGNLTEDRRVSSCSSSPNGSRLNTVEKLILDNDELRAKIDTLE